ncbi:hypothetical protein F0562_028050 [Nyssa sinensis]|uniref:Uncharacterized protein n=1 Tax=Nyssa sinensis TaxID=561372 RepID=A0A5J5B783_9ASTE|nr:hypothetical protein F0562_028050 [Nyssa sinensis]
MKMVMDDSFKKPGAVPFKWEIRPGVPKLQQPESKHHHRSFLEQQQQSATHHRSFSCAPQKLRPPPSGSYFQPPPPELRSLSFRSAPRSRSERHRFDGLILARPESVSSSGCFPTPLRKRKEDKKRAHKPKPEPDYTSDLETLSRWSGSSQKSLSPFRDSPSSWSFSSYQSSPQPVVG